MICAGPHIGPPQRPAPSTLTQISARAYKRVGDRPTEAAAAMDLNSPSSQFPSEQEQAMHDLSRVSFLVLMNAFLLAMLVLVLGGCSTPAQNRYRHGDFIMNVGSADPVIVEPRAGQVAQPSLAASSAPGRG